MSKCSIGKCHFCNKPKENLIIINILTFGEVKLCTRCWNSLRPVAKRVKSEIYSQLVPRTESINYLLPPKDLPDEIIPKKGGNKWRKVSDEN